MHLLQRSGALQAAHSGRTLFDHLLGTYSLLEDWRQPTAVCLAGLFHSIYGTNAFQRQSLAPDQRPELQAAIGREAEALAWLFCAIDRPGAILQALRKGQADAELAARCDRAGLTRAPLCATSQQIQALAEIETANLIEQGSWGSALRELYCTAIDRPGALSASATAALREGWARQLAEQEVNA
ncbi:DUF6817 domain-containing protein [Polaromonas sp. C04]|uniref:DUF6817 domain-containing protein n=1 Tax=Polaromonas sp. C04 TaxID=1945857 RepID=UPI0011859190|nr:hypothetical protein [Polaromonas sp. C04]